MVKNGENEKGLSGGELKMKFGYARLEDSGQLKKELRYVGPRVCCGGYKGGRGIVR